MRKIQALLGAFLLCAVAQAQNATSGTLTVANAACVSGSCVLLKFDSPMVGGASIQISGTFTATVQFEASSDGLALTDANKIWVAISGVPLNSPTPASSATTANTWQFAVSGITDIRARASAWTSTPTVVIRSSLASGVQPTGGAAGVTSGTASAITQPGTPMMCDTAQSGTVTAAQAQMVRCANNGMLVVTQLLADSDGVLNGAAAQFRDATSNTAIAPIVYNHLFGGGTTWPRWYSTSLTNLVPATTLTARNEVGAGLAEKGSRWSVFSNPAANSQATASIASESSVRHVVDCVSFSAGATTAPALTALTINVRDGATGAGTVIWSYEVIIPAATGQSVVPHSICGLNLVGTTATAMTAEFSAGLTSLIESVSISGFNVN